MLLSLLLACGDKAAPVDADGDGWSTDLDCNDEDPAVHPGIDDLCNGLDDDCDGEVDEADVVDPSTWYVDADGDGYGDPTASFAACVAPAGTVDNDGDRDDGEPLAWSGAEEACDGVDNDCDGIVDNVDSADASTWYEDADGDGHGAPWPPPPPAMPPPATSPTPATATTRRRRPGAAPPRPATRWTTTTPATPAPGTWTRMVRPPVPNASIHSAGAPQPRGGHRSERAGSPAIQTTWISVPGAKRVISASVLSTEPVCGAPSASKE